MHDATSEETHRGKAFSGTFASVAQVYDRALPGKGGQGRMGAFSALRLMSDDDAPHLLVRLSRTSGNVRMSNVRPYRPGR